METRQTEWKQAFVGNIGKVKQFCNMCYIIELSEL